MTSIRDLKFDENGYSVLVRSAEDLSPLLWIADERKTGEVDWEQYRLYGGTESVVVDPADYDNVEGIVKDFRRIMGLSYGDR